jgi:hypothetical protein
MDGARLSRTTGLQEDLAASGTDFQLEFFIEIGLSDGVRSMVRASG